MNPRAIFAHDFDSKVGHMLTLFHITSGYENTTMASLRSQKRLNFPINSINIDILRVFSDRREAQGTTNHISPPPQIKTTIPQHTWGEGKLGALFWDLKRRVHTLGREGWSKKKEIAIKTGFSPKWWPNDNPLNFLLGRKGTSCQSSSPPPPPLNGIIHFSQPPKESAQSYLGFETSTRKLDRVRQ